MFRAALVLTALLCIPASSFAQAAPGSGGSISAEADILSFALPGYSGIVSLTLPSKLQVSVGMGRYEVPSFMLKADENYETAKWKATVTSIQVARVTYRFKGAMKSGPAIGAVVLNQNWRLRSDNLDGTTNFRTLSVGLTAGYYAHIGRHFYLLPVTAFTRNSVSGSSSVKGTAYKIERFAPNASLHAGWEWGR